MKAIEGWQILVVDQSFVLVGCVSDQGDSLLVEKAKLIRKWGTTAGLGQLVNGPTKETVLDPTNGVVIVPRGRLVFSLAVSDTKWAKV